MGNCGSAPKVEGDARPPPPKPAAPPPPPANPKPPPEPPAAAASSNEAMAAVPSSSGITERSPSLPRKSKSMEIVENIPAVIPYMTPAVLAVDDKKDEEEPDGGWKVKRRVSRRLSLEVKRKPGSDMGSPSWNATPNEEAGWNAEADLLNAPGPVEVKVYQPAAAADSSSAPGEQAASTDTDPAATIAPVRRNVQKRPDEDLWAGMVGKSNLGGAQSNVATAVHSSGKPPTGQPAPKEGEGEGDMPGPWRVKRRGRRLSLEVEKAPDLALLAAIRRTSSAPLAGSAARQAVEQDNQRREAEAANPGAVGNPIPQFLPLTRQAPTLPLAPGRGGRGTGSPSSEPITVIDFASTSPKVAVAKGDGADMIAKAAEAAAANDAAADVASMAFVAKRRKSRRLSLEIEKHPNEEVLAAVRRSHSAPITAANAASAMGADEWAKVVAGEGGAIGASPGGAQPAGRNWGAGGAQVIDFTYGGTARNGVMPSASQPAEEEQDGANGVADMDDFSSWGTAAVLPARPFRRVASGVGAADGSNVAAATEALPSVTRISRRVASDASNEGEQQAGADK
eukprot:TRINITY_DN14404_c0_g1_i1.p1 TRINITY_DN14404_c0_g1~~TRINITY_DN14404_c0_g1_i1.p1  ORF type:complete len:567 (+),score=128.02 TRINITY_DN14404_c0_g1_i1:464-2164(+)